MRILVTGATGFIGGALLRRLQQEGHTVHALVRSELAAAALKRAGVRVHRGSIGDPNEIAEAARGADAVVHTAGIVSPRAAKKALKWVHIAGTENVINAAAHVGARRIVHLSCADVTLTNEDRVHWDERRDLMVPPVGHRAQSLKLAEEVALTHRPDDVDVVALRPTLVWGPGDRSLLPSILREAKEGGFRLYGDGRNLIGITYIDNLVDAILLALKADAAKVAGLPYYIADAEFLEAREFFGMMMEELDLPAPRKGPSMALSMALRRFGLGGAHLPEEMIKRARGTLFDIQRAVGDLGYDPAVGVEEGMKALAGWVAAKGGVDAIIGMEKEPPGEDTVAAQVETAGGERSLLEGGEKAGD